MQLQAMEDTQTIDWAAEEEEETERASESSGCSLEPVGRLRVFGGTYGPEKDFPLYLGKNVIGRMPDCSVALPFPSISKQHAVIEISAQDKAPVLQDCGSLNGTQILRPPKVLSPGASHRLRDHELILLADLPCQYCRLGVPLPVVSRGPLTIEETPRVPGDAHTTRPPLAEDSEEEADFLSEGRVGRESRTASSPVTVVPESDDEGPSPVLGGSGPSLAFSLDSDTEEDEAGKAFPAARSSTTTKTEQPRGDRVTHATRLVKAPPAVGRDRDTEVRKGAGNRVVLESSHPPGGDSDSDVDEDSRPAELLLERAQPSGFEDSDTDVEEEGIPATPAAALMTRRPILHAAGAGRPGAPGLARLPESPAGSDTDVEEQKCPAAGGQTSVVINSDTDEEEEVSAALTLAQLKEGRAALWNRDTDAEKARAQPLVLEWNPTSSGRDSDTDTEEGRLPVGKRETIPSASTEKAEPLVTAQSGKSRPPRGDGEGAGRHSRGTRLKRSQACPATVHIKTEAEEEVPPGPAVTHLASHHVPVQGTNRARPPGKANMEKDLASAVAAVRKSQRVAEGDAREMAPEVRAPGRTPAAQGEQVVHTATPRDPSLLQRGRAQTPTGRRKKSCLARVRGSKDSLDAGCDDLDLQATQCFVESENLQAVPGVEDEPTQAFPCVLCPEPSTPHCSSQAPGSLDEPWEVLATQPFCVGASEHPEPLPTATLLEAHASHLSPPRAAQDECPRSRAHTEPLGTEGRGLRTVERDRGHMASKMPPAESTPRDDLESPDAGPPAAVPTALAPPSPPAPGPCISQSRKQAVPRPLLPSLPSCEPPIPRAGRTGKQKAPEPALSSELETLRPKPTARRRPRGRMTPTLLSSAAHTPHLPVPTEQPAASEPEPQTSLARTRRSSIKTPEAAEPAAPELQPSTSTHQPVAPEPAPRATRSRENRSSVKTPEAAVHTAPELRLSTATDQLVIPKTTPRATRGRTDRSSVKTPEAAESAAPELQPSTSTHQPDTREPVPRATRSRVNRSSVKTSEVADPAALELQPSTSTHQPVVPKTTPQATRSRTCRSSSETVKSVEPSATELKPPTVTAQPVKTETVAEDWVASESQPPVTTDRTVPQEPDPQACCSRRQRAAGKRGSRTAPIVHQPCSEPQDRASGDQRAGRRRAAASLGTIPDPSFSPLPEAPTHAPQIPKVEAVDSSGSTRELQPAASLRRKRPSRSTDPPPLPKQPQREASQKTVLPKNEEDDTAERPEKAEDVGIPGPGKRKRTQMEEEPQEVPKRGLRRPKPTLQSAAPKVLFTGVLDARGEQAVLALGGSLASSVAEASHLVTDRIRRTVKFLCALGKGIPVLSLAWLQQSHKAGHFLPPDQFVVTDPEQERNFGFSLRDALSRARERRLLEGYEIHVTPGVQPPPLQMGEIVSCCGGTVLPSMPRSYKPQRVVITCPQDLPRCSSASRAGLPLLSPEFLLTGVLKQEVRPEAFVLSAREPSST
ncbi:PREDICTED: mediator of DNA damage checkpoint protein 1 isoform X3 [Chinchilla lanigera]|uniref:mediator of DNA damage checkpoint protein 1 isoform X3 n=1 Tax=Chinchilla lanigera TaxID=34839 RepID=UPI00069791F9|nr:PREDICTED: mediator of DNA damage checkpoint protein 1 isoform X3 [Chinchilla lanigera]